MKKVLLLLLAPLSAVWAQTVVLTLDAPDTNISGLAFGAGSMWAVDGTTRYVYRLDTSTGDVLDSWYVHASGANPTGLGFGNNQVYVGLTNSAIFYYNTAGTFQSDFVVNC